MIETAYAKINLALHVRRRRNDGYHDIETLFAFAEDGDTLRVRPSDELSLQIDGPFARDLPIDDNLVLRAARALRKATGVGVGAALHLTKTLPVASGIGGGSADGAAALRLLCRFWDVDPGHDQLNAIAARLGADIPACLASGTVMGVGKGDELRTFRSGFEGAPLLLVNPLVPLATGPVFEGWNGMDRGPLDAVEVSSWRNDLTASAVALVPGIGGILERLGAMPGVALARMSGSGATCYAVFDNVTALDAAAKALPDFWTLATRLRSS